jgi:hypothetical protein
LIAQYPIMMALSAAVATFAPSASRYSLTAVILHRQATTKPLAIGLRRWV